MHLFIDREGINSSLWNRVVQEKCLSFSKKMKLVASQKHNWNLSITPLKNIAVLELSIDVNIQKVNLSFLKSMINLEVLRLHIENNSSLVHILSLLCYSFPKLHHLEIEIGLNSELKRTDVFFFEKSLHYFKHLDTFILKFKKVTIDKYTANANELLSALSKGIHNMSQLKNFEFDMLPYDYDEKIFSDFLQNLFKLESISNLCLKNIDTETHEKSLAKINQMKNILESSFPKLNSLSIHRIPLISSMKIDFLEKLIGFKSLKSLNLGIRATQPKNNRFDSLGENLLPLKQLEKLNLSLDDFAISGDLENLGSNLGKLVFLTSLKIDIPNIDFINFDDIAKFCNGVVNLHELREFCFTYGHLHPQSSLSLKPLVKKFAAMEHLTYFKIAEWSISERKDDDLFSFLDIRSTATEKDCLELEIRPFDLNTYRLIHRASLVNSMPNLKCLSIKAEGCLDLEIEDLVELLKSFSDFALEVTELKLDLAQCTALKADSFPYLVTAINRFNLKSLCLDLDKNNLSDDCMMYFADVLHFQKKLEKLDIGLGAFGGATSVGMIYLYQEVGKLSNLQSLKICHCNYSFSRVLWKMVSQELSRMKNLKSLTLEYFACGFMTDYSLEQLSLALSELKHLCFFRFLPGSNSSFSDFGLSCLLRQILEMKDLAEIRIDFKNVPSKISNQMKEHFIEMLNKMPAMKSNNVTYQG